MMESVSTTGVGPAGHECSVPLGTRVHNTGILLAALARVAWRYPVLRRWFLGNRLRQLTVGAEYALRTDGYSGPPRSVSFRPTLRCNAHCQMCPYANAIDPDSQQPVTHDPQALELEVAYRLVAAIAPSHTMVNVTGGEPLLWGENLFAFLDYCRRRAVATSVTTNGTLLGRHLEALWEAPPDILVISLLGPEETHNGIVGLNAYAAIRDALGELYARKGGDCFRRPLVITNTAMLPENSHVFAEVVDLSRSLGAWAANFQPVWFATEQMHEAHERWPSASAGSLPRASLPIDPEATDPAQVWQQMQRARRLSAQLGQPIHFYPRLRQRDMEPYYHQPQQPVGRSRALCPYLICQVFPDGTVSPCAGVPAGNLYQQDLRAIWNGPAMRTFRRRLKAAGMLPICSRCCFLWRND